MPASGLCEELDEGFQHRCGAFKRLGFDVGFRLPIHRFCDDFVGHACAAFPFIVDGILEFPDGQFVISLIVVSVNRGGVGEVIFFIGTKLCEFNERFVVLVVLKVVVVLVREFVLEFVVLFLFLFLFVVVVGFVFVVFVLKLLI